MAVLLVGEEPASEPASFVATLNIALSEDGALCEAGQMIWRQLELS